MAVETTKQTGFVSLYVHHLRVTKQSAFVTFYPAKERTEVQPESGGLTYTGGTPTISAVDSIRPIPGGLTYTGGTPVVLTQEFISPESGGLTYTGGTPTISEVTYVAPSSGSLEFTGGEPMIYTERAAVVSQQVVIVSGRVVPDARLSQQVVIAAAEVIPPVRVSQQVVIVAANVHPCVTRLCQVWLIKRADGREFAYTSHDRPVWFIGRWFSPLASLQPSATEAASELGAVGNMELMGVLTDDAITERDIRAGLFDNATLEVWEVPWHGDTPQPIRLAAGSIGAVSHGRDGFKAEVLGIGAKLNQQAITTVLTAACRFVFGDARCGKDLGPLRVSGSVGAVSSYMPFRTFSSPDLVLEKPENYFARGVVKFTSGPNEGTAAEVKEYDPATGSVTIWTPSVAAITPGTTFEITPGCTLAPSGDMGCKYWSNYINFGGFPDVPGVDGVSETPVAKV